MSEAEQKAKISAELRLTILSDRFMNSYRKNQVTKSEVLDIMVEMENILDPVACDVEDLDQSPGDVGGLYDEKHYAPRC